jgi:sulfur transfer complex TusBCD TusB component (DsrH family)
VRKNAYLDTIWEEIIKFIRDALEARGCVREIKTVEISMQEFMEYFKSIGLESWCIRFGRLYPI